MVFTMACSNGVRVSKSILSGTIYLQLNSSAYTAYVYESVYYALGYGRTFRLRNVPDYVIVYEQGEQCIYYP